ncbi:MAG: Ig-like domain-containing protein [Candidatus Methanomethylicaceae archaeon]
MQLYNPTGTMIDIDYTTSSPTGTYTLSSFKIPLKIPSGSWIYGVYTVRAYSVDQSTNVTFTLESDTTPPTISFLSPTNGSTVSSINLIVSVTYSDNIATDVSSVKLLVDGIDVTSTATITSIRTEYMPGTPLAEGLHSIYFEVKDIAGNKASETWVFTVSLPDLIFPVISSVYPSDGSKVNARTFTLNATYSDNKEVDLSSISLLVDDTRINLTLVTPSYLRASVTLFDGTHSAFLSLADTAGNRVNMSWTFLVDTTPPTISGDILNNNTVFNKKDVNFTLSLSDNIAVDIGSLLMKIDGSTVTPAVNGNLVTYSGSLSEGIHTVQVSVKDTTGNTASKTFTFVISLPVDYTVYILVVVIVAAIVGGFLLFLRKK